MIANAGTGSLREMIACAQTGDTIRFDASLSGLTVEIDAPTMVIDKDLLLLADFAHHISLSNVNAANSAVLLSVQSDLELQGLKVVGKTDDSLILKIESGGSVELKNCELEKILIDKDP